MLRTQQLRVIALLAALSTGGAACAKTSLDVYFGDGGTSAFYRWDGTLDAPGKMLRQEPVGDGFYDAHASVAQRILYSSTDGRFDRGVIEASGLLYLPKGTPPPGG